MKNFFALCAFVASFQLYAFTLSSENPHRFPLGDVKINMFDVEAYNCTKLGISSDDLLELAVNAAEKYWNISESNIHFIKGSVIQNSNTESVLVGCTNKSVRDMGYITSNNLHLVLISTKKQIDLAFKDLDKNQQLKILGHEIGHAIGIGHSQYSDAFMHFSMKANSLSQDDVNAIQFLYGIN